MKSKKDMMMLTERQQNIFNLFLANPDEQKVTGDFLNLGIERTTIFRDLKTLVQAELLTTEGKAYRLNEKSDAYMRWDLSRPPHERKGVKYNPSLLENYQPNKSFLLTDQQMRSMEMVGTVSGVAQAEALGKPYERVLSSLLIDLTHASSNFENVNISWLDTKALIEFGERPEGLSERQLRIVLNHKEAIGYLKEHSHDLSMRKSDLMDIHSLLIQGLLGDPAAVGALRTVIVKFDDSKYLPPDNPDLLREAFEVFCEKVNAIQNPHEQAFFAMSFIPYLQPFQDGNKRTSRIAMNIPLIKHGLAPFSFSDMGKRDYMFGLLALYERGRFNFLAEAFSNAYEKSALRYAELIDHVNEGGTLSTISDSKATDGGSVANDDTPSDKGGGAPKKSRSRGPGLSM